MLGKGCLNGCLGKAVLVGVVTGAALAGWRWGPVVFPSVQEWFGGEEETVVEVLPSPELAEAALDLFARFRR